MRRGMAPLITILFPLRESGAEAVRRIENLYEQTFSNYLCYVLDLSADMRVTADLSRISHPVTDFKWFPNTDGTTALLHAAQMVQSPYSYILGQQSFKDTMDLTVMFNQMEKAPAGVLSDYYSDDHKLVNYRYTIDPNHEPIELFRRQSLADYMKANFMSMGDPE